jgi:hypothetical protein
VDVLANSDSTDDLIQGVKDELWQRAENLVNLHWHIIESLAEALPAKPRTQQPPSEMVQGWSHGESIEKFMPASDVFYFFQKLNIPV